ncbi:MAG: type II secretion system F family protein [Candidatus Hydrothermarchaeales archaeon]
MANILLRLVDRVGESTLSGAERAYRRAAELSTVFKEQDAAARALLDRQKETDSDRRKAMEEKLTKIKEAVSTEIEEEVKPEFQLDREELKVPFSARLIDIISDLFSGYTAGPSSFFTNIQEDLYRANILMPASKYIALSVGVSVITGVVFGIVFSIGLATVLGASGGALGLVLALPIALFTLIFAKMYPKSKVKGRSDGFSRELPFALRHMSTQLTSGSGLLETMRSVSMSDYGVLSEEFKRAILEIERGATIEEAYERMNLRVESDGLKKASRQIISTLRTGGNLANTLKVIAEEVSTEMRMKLKDFIQILNTFSMMYMFAVVVAPVLITTLVIAFGIAMKGLPISPEIMWLLYMAFFGIGVYMSIMIKRFEPKV